MDLFRLTHIGTREKKIEDKKRKKEEDNEKKARQPSKKKRKTKKKKADEDLKWIGCSRRSCKKWRQVPTEISAMFVCKSFYCENLQDITKTPCEGCAETLKCKC